MKSNNFEIIQLVPYSDNFDINFPNKPSNFHFIKEIRTLDSSVFSEGKWIFCLIAWWSGPDHTFFRFIEKNGRNYPNVNFGFSFFDSGENVQNVITKYNLRTTPFILSKHREIVKTYRLYEFTENFNQIILNLSNE